MASAVIEFVDLAASSDEDEYSLSKKNNDSTTLLPQVNLFSVQPMIINNENEVSSLSMFTKKEAMTTFEKDQEPSQIKISPKTGTQSFLASSAVQTRILGCRQSLINMALSFGSSTSCSLDQSKGGSNPIDAKKKHHSSQIASLSINSPQELRFSPEISGSPEYSVMGTTSNVPERLQGSCSSSTESDSTLPFDPEENLELLELKATETYEALHALDQRNAQMENWVVNTKTRIESSFCVKPVHGVSLQTTKASVQPTKEPESSIHPCRSSCGCDENGEDFRMKYNAELISLTLKLQQMQKEIATLKTELAERKFDTQSMQVKEKLFSLIHQLEKTNNNEELADLKRGLPELVQKLEKLLESGTVLCQMEQTDLSTTSRTNTAVKGAMPALEKTTRGVRRDNHGVYEDAFPLNKEILNDFSTEYNVSSFIGKIMKRSFTLEYLRNMSVTKMNEEHLNAIINATLEHFKTCPLKDSSLLPRPLSQKVVKNFMAKKFNYFQQTKRNVKEK